MADAGPLLPNFFCRSSKTAGSILHIPLWNSPACSQIIVQPANHQGEAKESALTAFPARITSRFVQFPREAKDARNPKAPSLARSSSRRLGFCGAKFFVLLSRGMVDHRLHSHRRCVGLVLSLSLAVIPTTFSASGRGMGPNHFDR